MQWTIVQPINVSTWWYNMGMMRQQMLITLVNIVVSKNMGYNMRVDKLNCELLWCLSSVDLDFTGPWDRCLQMTLLMGNPPVWACATSPTLCSTFGSPLSPPRMFTDTDVTEIGCRDHWALSKSTAANLFCSMFYHSFVTFGGVWSIELRRVMSAFIQEYFITAQSDRCIG